MGKAVKAASRVIAPIQGKGDVGKLGGLVKGIGGVFGLGGSATYNPQTAKKEYFDISKEVKPAQEEYAAALERQKGLVGVTAPAQRDVLAQMGQAALGKGPSLAEAQLKAASDRNLAQQLAATQGRRGGGALAQRSLLQNMGASGRDLAQQAAIERLKERQNFLGQASLAEEGLRQDITGKMNLDIAPKRELQNWELGRVADVNKAAQLEAEQNRAGRAALLSGIVKGGMAAFGGGEGGAAAGGTVAVAKAEGGLVEGPGTETSDSIPARLSNGEFVVKADVVKKPGVLEHLMKLNDGEKEVKTKGYKSGGLVKKDDDMNPKATTVIPDKGYGKIIIIESDSREDKKTKKFAEGGLVGAQSLAEALLKSDQNLMSSKKDMLSKRPDAGDSKKKKRLEDALMDEYRRGAKPLSPAGIKARDKK